VRGNIHRAVLGESIGTLVGGSCEIIWSWEYDAKNRWGDSTSF
jgi:hypothetical protein